MIEDWIQKKIRNINKILYWIRTLIISMIRIKIAQRILHQIEVIYLMILNKNNFGDFNENEEEYLFKINFSKFPLDSNKNFLQRKRNLTKNKLDMKTKNILSEDHLKYFESVLQKQDNYELEEKNNIQNFLMECRRILVTKIDSKKKQY